MKWPMSRGNTACGRSTFHRRRARTDTHRSISSSDSTSATGTSSSESVGFLSSVFRRILPSWFGSNTDRQPDRAVGGPMETSTQVVASSQQVSQPRASRAASLVAVARDGAGTLRHSRVPVGQEGTPRVEMSPVRVISRTDNRSTDRYVGPPADQYATQAAASYSMRATSVPLPANMVDHQYHGPATVPSTPSLQYQPSASVQQVDRMYVPTVPTGQPLAEHQTGPPYPDRPPPSEQPDRPDRHNRTNIKPVCSGQLVRTTESFQLALHNMGITIHHCSNTRGTPTDLDR